MTSARSGKRDRRQPLRESCRSSRRRAPARPKNHDAAMPRPTATSGAGECGQSRSMATSTTSVATATPSVSSEVSGMCWATLSRSGKKPCLVMWVPSSLGTWSSTITRPMPALKPVSTGAEMKSATKPRRATRASSSIAPTSAVSVAVAVIELGRVAVGTTMRELGAGEDRQGRRRADAQHPRRAEHRVDDHRDEGGVQAHRHRQSGHGRIRHRLGNHDGRGGQAGDDVEAPDVARGRLRFGGHAMLLARPAQRDAAPDAAPRLITPNPGRGYCTFGQRRPVDSRRRRWCDPTP